MIHYHLLLARKHGSLEAVPLLASYSADTSAISRKYEELSGSGSAEFGKTYAELLFVSDGIPLANHDFPDPAQVAKQQKQKALAEARRVATENELARAAHAAAKERLNASAAALKELTPEQKQLLAEDDAAKAKAAAEQKAREEAAAKAKADAEAAEAARIAEARAAADRAAARDTFIAELSALDDVALAAQCAANKLGVHPADPREVLIAALVKAAGFDS